MHVCLDNLKRNKNIEISLWKANYQYVSNWFKMPDLGNVKQSHEDKIVWQPYYLATVLIAKLSMLKFVTIVFFKNWGSQVSTVY